MQLRIVLSELILALVILLPGCENEILRPDPPFGSVDGLTAHYDSLDVTLIRGNSSWFPRDGAIAPGEGENFVTLLIRVVNTSGSSRQFRISDFRLTTLSSDPLHESLTWQPFQNGRKPSLGDVSLEANQQLDGWLTFRVPQDTVREIVAPQVLESLVWSPMNPDVALALPFPDANLERFFEVFFFGSVMDENGRPVPGATVEITPINPYVHPIAQYQSCRGNPEPTQQYISDGEGHYAGTFRRGPTSYELCVNVTVTSPSGLASADSSGVWTKMGIESALTERPELRIDLQLTSD